MVIFGDKWDIFVRTYHIFNDFQNIASKLGSNSKLQPSDFVETENLYSCVMNIFQATITVPPEI